MVAKVYDGYYGSGHFRIFRTTSWDKIFELVEIFVVASLEWENVINFISFGCFTRWTYGPKILHVVLYKSIS